MNRRQFLTGAAGLVAAATGTLGYTLWVEPHWLEIVERELLVAGLPGALRGARLVQLSDLHVGPRVADDYLVETLHRTAQLQPDIVAITGDVVSYTGEQEIVQLGRVLRELPRGRLASVAVLGNHDYGFTWRMPEVADAVSAELTRAGVTVLRNHAADIRGLSLIGLGDLWSFEFAPEHVLPSRGAGPGIVLCHNPDAVDRPGWGSFRGWVLAGHTHGGQCKPPFLPPPILPVENPRYTSGEIQIDDARRLYISRGVGHLMAARFNVRPEITVFTLMPA